MITVYLLDELKSRLPSHSFVTGEAPDAIATFPAVHPQVGDLKIYDDGDEARVEITKITHGHFSCYDETIGQEEREKDIAESVVDFVEQIFAHKVVFSLNANGRIGGWRTISPNEPLPEKSLLKKYFIWSGPLHH